MTKSEVLLKLATLISTSLVISRLRFGPMFPAGLGCESLNPDTDELLSSKKFQIHERSGCLWSC